MDGSPPDSSVHGILQARILEWVAMPPFRGPSRLRDWTCGSSLAGEFFTTEPPGKPKLPNRNSNFQFEVLEGIEGYRIQNVAQDKKRDTYPTVSKRENEKGWILDGSLLREEANAVQENVSGDGLGEEVTEDMLPKYEASSRVQLRSEALSLQGHQVSVYVTFSSSPWLFRGKEGTRRNWSKVSRHPEKSSCPWTV